MVHVTFTCLRHWFHKPRMELHNNKISWRNILRCKLWHLKQRKDCKHYVKLLNNSDPYMSFLQKRKLDSIEIRKPLWNGFRLFLSMLSQNFIFSSRLLLSMLSQNFIFFTRLFIFKRISICRSWWIPKPHLYGTASYIRLLFIVSQYTAKSAYWFQPCN